MRLQSIHFQNPLMKNPRVGIQMKCFDQRENSVAISACINFNKPNPTNSNSMLFTSLNTAIAARPGW